MHIDRYLHLRSHHTKHVKRGTVRLVSLKTGNGGRYVRRKFV